MNHTPHIRRSPSLFHLSTVLLLLSLLLCGCAATGGETIFGSPLPIQENTHARELPPLSESPRNQAVSPIPPDLLPEEPKEPPPEEETAILSFVGDVMLAAENGYDGFWSFNLFAYDTPPAYYFEKMLPIFSSDDLTVANGENVFTDRDLPKAEKEGELAFWYYSGTENARIYAEGGIDVVSLANNHAMDYGLEGREDTAAALEQAGVVPMREGRTYLFEKGGVKVGILFASMYSEYYCEQMMPLLSELVQNTDFQIVYYHGGTERVHTPDAWRVRACHALVDAGADLVLGSHPHVLQPMETYKGVDIVYSLGNFLFGGSHTCENRTVVYQLCLTIKEGTVTEVNRSLIPCYCYGELWQPTPIEKEDPAYERVLDFLRGEREKPY